MSGSKKQFLKKKKSHVDDDQYLKKHNPLFCCSCRHSVSSSEEDADVGAHNCISHCFEPISNLAHTMVQAELEKMIKERALVESRNEGGMSMWKQKKSNNKVTRANSSSSTTSSSSKCIIMVAMDMYSYNIREDFRDSMVEVIIANRIDEPKDLRRLLNCYVSLNSLESKPIILEVFHEVCSDLFLY